MFLILIVLRALVTFFFFFFNDTATTEIYTLSLHDALPISPAPGCVQAVGPGERARQLSLLHRLLASADRKSTRLNSSHLVISYAVFCLKKKTPHFTIAHTIEHLRHISPCHSSRRRPICDRS